MRPEAVRRACRETQARRFAVTGWLCGEWISPLLASADRHNSTNVTIMQLSRNGFGPTPNVQGSARSADHERGEESGTP